MKNQMLLIDSCGDNSFSIDLNESNVSKGLLKFRGKFQESEKPNKNMRIYSHSILDENVQRLQDEIKKRGLVGEIDHPESSIIHFERASHVITKLWWEGNILMGTGEVLSTPHGDVLKALLNDGIRVGMSSRGVGNGKVNENGILVISDNFRLLTFDCVSQPSTNDAYQEKVVSQKESIIPQNIIEKNNDTRIYKITKEAAIAAIGGAFKTSTSKIKSGL